MYGPLGATLSYTERSSGARASAKDLRTCLNVRGGGTRQRRQRTGFGGNGVRVPPQRSRAFSTRRPRKTRQSNPSSFYVGVSNGNVVALTCMCCCSSAEVGFQDEQAGKARIVMTRSVVRGPWPHSHNGIFPKTTKITTTTFHIIRPQQQKQRGRHHAYLLLCSPTFLEARRLYQRG